MAKDELKFEWDTRKAEANRRKHGIEFDIAMLAFYDPLKSVEMEGHEHGEIRWRTIGEVNGRILVVSYTIHEESGVEINRLISARKATRRERQKYEEAP